MEITPEKLAFIQGTTTITRPTEPLVTEVSLKNSGPQGNDSQPSPRPRQRSERTDATEDAKTSLVGTVLVPLTSRLQPKTADALKRAYLEQKLKGRLPATQQEIIEAALQTWLKKEGYL